MTSSTDTDFLAIMAQLNNTFTEPAKPPQRAAAAGPATQRQVVTARRSQNVMTVAAASASTPAAAASGPRAAQSMTKQQEVLEFIAQNRNIGTSRAYASGWAGFARYLEREGINQKDITEWAVADYLRERVTVHGVAASTMSSDRSAIADKLKHTVHKDIMQSAVVAEMMSVLRTQAAPSKPKQHMSAALMRELIVAHDQAGPSGGANAWLKERDIFLMLLMMMAFLRESEAVALTLNDVELKAVRLASGATQQVIHVFVARSKTDQAKVGHVVLLGVDNDATVCPVRRYAIYRAAVAAAGVESEQFFPTVSGTAMSSNTPCGIVQRAVRQANTVAEASGFGANRWGEPESYGSHSLRRGGVTTARANGVSMLDIQKHGRWKSLTVFSYVGTTAEEQLAVTNGFLGTATAVEAPEDEVPSKQSHVMRAAAATSVKTAGKRSRKRRAAAAESESESGSEAPSEDGDDEVPTRKMQEDAEDLMFVEMLNQGYDPPRAKRMPSRGAKSEAASRAAKAKKKTLTEKKPTKKKRRSE